MLAMIITDDGAAACAEIDRVADRGSTILQGRGGYGGQDVVLCACSNKQLYEIEHAVRISTPAVSSSCSNPTKSTARAPAVGVGEEREPERINFSENAFVLATL